MVKECKYKLYNKSVKESLIEDNFCPWMPIDYKTFYSNSVEVSSGYRPGLR
jgi:hypothetical protein